jgi:YVTN family beta-propeller protein
LNEFSDSVSIIQGTQVITTLLVGGRLPTDIAYDSNTNQVYVVTGYAPNVNLSANGAIQGNLTIIADDKVTDIVSLGDTFSVFIEVDPVYEYIYVGAAGGDVVVLKDHQEVARYKGDYTMDAMDIDLRTGDVYVLAPASDGINFNRFREGKLIERLDVEGEGGTVDALQVHPTTGDIYIIDVLLREVVVVRPEANAEQGLSIIGRVPVGNGPSRMAIDPQTGNVYVANIFSNDVTAIQGTEVLTTYQVGWYPYGIGVNPANGWVYVANTNEDSITILGFAEK